MLLIEVLLVLGVSQKPVRGECEQVLNAIE